MATPAHCLYCFETLSASLERRQPLSFAQLEDLWDRYVSSQQDGDGESDHAAPAQSDDEDEGDERDVEMAGVASRSGRRHLPSSSADSRGYLNVPSRASGASSSTPSLASNASSSRTDSSVSMASSRSSASSGSRRQTSKQKPLGRPAEYPVFVTWNTIGSNGSRSLRGCIGTFEAQPLDQGLKSYALTSAFEDTRFLPITASELPSLECGVTLLTDFEPAPSPMAWELGKHGLRISFTHHSKRYGATYLPDVAREQGWTKTETMVSLMRKAGWNGRRDEWQNVGDLSVVRYQGHKVNVAYEDWRLWNDWVRRQSDTSSTGK